MEFCSGGSLMDVVLYGRKMNEMEIASCIYCVLNGLKHLHRKNITHRDIKGANILLASFGVAKITDFGVSKIGNKGNKMKTTIGTPYWMAPEVIMQGDYDNSADIWSLGITAIELADGKPPRSEMHPMRAMRAIPSKEPPTFQNPNEWSNDFNIFIRACLQKEPQDRPTAKQLLKSAFARSSKRNYRKVLKKLHKDTHEVISQYKGEMLDESIATTQDDIISLNPTTKVVQSYTREEGTAKFAEEDIATIIYNDDFGTTVINEDYYDNGTTIINDYGTTVINDYGTTIINDEYDSGTFVIHDDDDTGTVIIRDEEDYDTGTVVIH
eukprot:TRINITY_DN2140_c0_g1_i1.p1 TRINITY_DN2140_c0_g1~~TRINITY_DN2140_c0_g1_i1.p1  ORF type:complete len:325 (-),score=77.75 TRINITY_DN2140_c0_g1_i1:121-1095(-)